MLRHAKTFASSFVLLVAAACSTEQKIDPKECTPGEKIACECPDGTPSTQTCKDDGSGFGDCECSGESGSGGAGGAGAGGARPSSSVSSGMPSGSVASSSGGSMSSSATGQLTGCPEIDCPTCLASECAKLVCETEYKKCQANPDCVGLEACLAKCGSDLECPQECQKKYPGGAKDYSAKSTCFFCSPDACKALCDTTNTCK